METLWDILVARLGVKDGFHRLIGPCRVDIHPVVLLCVVGYRIVLVAHALSIASVARLECVEVHPWSFAEPFRACVPSAWVVCHDVVLVYRLYCRGECVPHLCLYIALYVASHEPYDIWRVLIAVGKECPVLHCIVLAEQSCLDETSPYAHHADVYSLVLGLLYDIVHVVPVAIDALAVDGREVPSVRVRHLSVVVVGRDAVDDLHLHDIVSCLAASLQVVGCLGTVCALGQEPACLAEPEERSAVLML